MAKIGFQCWFGFALKVECDASFFGNRIVQDQELKILLAAPAIDIERLSSALAGARFKFSFHLAENAEAATEGLAEFHFDCAFIGETLPDEGGAALLPHLFGHGLEAPVIFVFDKTMDISGAIEVVRTGAADCFHESEISADRIERAMLTALRFYRERTRAIKAQNQLVVQALFDPLTDLPNRGLFF